MINTVSAQAATFGAVQNRLSYTIDNLNTYNENLTAAQAQITDVDMASEMTKFTGRTDPAAGGHLNAVPGRAEPTGNPQAPR